MARWTSPARVTPTLCSRQYRFHRRSTFRQWVSSVTKHLRYVLQRDPEALSAVLHILLRVIEARLRQRTGCVGRRLGAVSLWHHIV
jgi:hypothetical protein